MFKFRSTGFPFRNSTDRLLAAGRSNLNIKSKFTETLKSVVSSSKNMKLQPIPGSKKPAYLKPNDASHYNSMAMSQTIMPKAYNSGSPIEGTGKRTLDVYLNTQEVASPVGGDLSDDVVQDFQGGAIPVKYVIPTRTLKL